MKKTLTALLVSMLLGSAVWAAEQGLVAHWDFSEGKGDVLRDKSGNENHGKISGATWTKLPKGYALRFDGADDHVDCGAGASLDLRDQFSMEFWVWPDRRLKGGEPGIVGKAFKSYVTTLFYGKAYSYVGASSGRGNVEFSMAMRNWQHLVSTYDGEHLRLYVNGKLAVERPRSGKVARGAHFWMGRSDGSVKYTKNAHFNGMLTEVKVYNRALTRAEIVEHLRLTAAAKGLLGPSKVVLRITPHPALGKIRATLDARGLRPLTEGTVLRADVCKIESRKPVIRAEAADAHELGVGELLIDAQKLPPGTYVVRAAAIEPDGTVIGKESSAELKWPGRPAESRNVKVLNNLCWELLNVSGAGLASAKHLFANADDRWVVIQTTAEIKNGGKLWISLDGDPADKAVSIHQGAGESRQEAMRRLPAGRHTVHVGREGNAGLRRLVIRSIPILQHAFYSNPHFISCIRPYGPYNWKFLAKDVLPNVNVMIGNPRGKHVEPDHLEEWTNMGRSWITITDNARKFGKDGTVDDVHGYWAGAMGLQHALMDGIIVDEFDGGNDAIYDVYREAVERIGAAPPFKGKAFIAYGGTFYGADRSREFARACLKAGGYVAWERYLRELPTEAEAQAAIRGSMTNRMHKWEEALPGVTRRMIMVLGLMTQPIETINIHPSADFRVFMDMQFRELATHPAFFGLGGIQEYFAWLADEETLRLAGRLYRHYAIEGNTEPLIKDPYELTHILNPDFADPFSGWAVSPAETGTVQIKVHAGYSWLQGRYPRTSVGDTFLWTKRSAKKANAFSQEIKDLTPGRLYSMKMMTGDYGDLVAGRSASRTHGISIQLENVDLLPGPKKSFQHTFAHWLGEHDLGKFKGKRKYYMNYHWRVFRAKAETARLTVSDWKSEKERGGPVGQELMYNFIEVQPYIGD